MQATASYILNAHLLLLIYISAMHFIQNKLQHCCANLHMWTKSHLQEPLVISQHWGGHHRQPIHTSANIPRLPNFDLLSKATTLLFLSFVSASAPHQTPAALCTTGSACLQSIIAPSAMARRLHPPKQARWYRGRYRGKDDVPFLICQIRGQLMQDWHASYRCCSRYHSRRYKCHSRYCRCHWRRRRYHSWGRGYHSWGCSSRCISSHSGYSGRCLFSPFLQAAATHCSASGGVHRVMLMPKVHLPHRLQHFEVRNTCCC